MSFLEFPANPAPLPYTPLRIVREKLCGGTSFLPAQANSLPAVRVRCVRLNNLRSALDGSVFAMRMLYKKDAAAKSLKI